MSGTRLVGLTCRRLATGRVTGWKSGGYGELAAYAEAVVRAGGTPVLLVPHALDDDGAHRLLDRLDAVVLTGGPDVDPARYGEEAHPSVYGVDPAVDAFEGAIARALVARNQPALAICRGLQVLNVALGGSLHQHIPDDPALGPHGVPGRHGHPAVHPVTLSDDSALARLVGRTIIAGSSHHHQAVARVGAGLRVVGTTDDGVIEAIEAASAPNVLAVQWHPEDTAVTDPVNQALFDALVTPRPD